MVELQGKDFVAVHALARREDDGTYTPIAAVDETCERVTGSRAGGSVSEALENLLASGHIKPVEADGDAPTNDDSTVEQAEPAAQANASGAAPARRTRSKKKDKE